LGNRSDRSLVTKASGREAKRDKTVGVIDAAREERLGALGKISSGAQGLTPAAFDDRHDHLHLPALPVSSLAGVVAWRIEQVVHLLPVRHSSPARAMKAAFEGAIAD
jgi:hypothetical protein